MALRLVAGGLTFGLRLEEVAAPRTCAAMVSRLLPLEAKLVQSRWSGEAAWVPLGALDLGVALENGTRFPAPGQLLFYPAGLSEAEILLPYGPTSFGSKLGPLAGSHFATIVEGLEQLGELGRRVLWEGAQGFRLEVLR
ncbi:MAG TPA: DUF3830 family protein [Bacillota bacterium]|nr:DUF3830 family protein [Bacillota bacterium]